MNVGTIQDTETLKVRTHRRSGGKPLGEIEEAFAASLTKGDTFLIGGKIVDILDSEEQSDLNNAINQTLTKNPDNVSNKWKSQKNIDTNAEIIPLNSYKIDQNTCRDFTKIVKKGQKQVQEKSTACRDEKGNWKII